MCGKIPYSTRLKAQQSVGAIKKRRSSKDTERSIYYCEKCGAYHLTSMDQYHFRAIDQTSTTEFDRAVKRLAKINVNKQVLKAKNDLHKKIDLMFTSL